jgi:hypothetical protein
MRRIFVFVDGKPVTLFELALDLDIKKTTLRQRARRCRNRRTHQGVSCAVFGEKELAIPAGAGRKKEKTSNKTSNKKALASIAAWDDWVRNRV